MITMLGSPRRCCDGITRRECLQAGALSALGGLFGLPSLLDAEEARGFSARPGKAKSVIVLYLMGGAATQDMFDMKPAAPEGVRSEFKPIATRVPGLQICEHLPRSAQWMHKAAIVRTVNHKGGCHNPLPSYTGYDVPVPTVTSTSDSYPPSMGSVCEFLRQGKGDLPAYVYLPNYMGWGQAIRRPGPYAGFLGKRYDPVFTECHPSIDKGLREGLVNPKPVRGVPFIPDAALAEAITLDRLDSRRSLLRQLDDQHRRMEASAELAGYDRVQQRAFSVLTSAKIKSVFNLHQEDPRVADRYGRTLFGNSALLARRLVEAGVRFVNVTWDSYWDRFKLDWLAWDTHHRHYPILREHLLPGLDLPYSALLEDLDDRGLLDETLVVLMSDFGRAPRMNRARLRSAPARHQPLMSDFGRAPRMNGNTAYGPGREHWTYCYSVVFAGAGIRGGTVCGTSDADAAYIKDRPVSTGDVCATIYHCLGIDPEMPVHDRSGRPLPIAHGGQPIREILA